MISKFYENNDLIYTEEEILFLEDYFKNNFLKCKTWADFEINIKDLLSKNPAMKNEFFKQFNNKSALQPSITTEINVCATIAKILGLDFNTNINYNDIRYQYLKDNIILNQKGNPNQNDAELIIQNKVFNIEIKKPIARANEKDLNFDENGKLLHIDDADIYDNIIDIFNLTTNLFNELGHNYEITDIAYQNYFKKNKIDYYASYVDDKLVMIPVDKINNLISLKGSEIRTTGKNKYKIFTSNYFYSVYKDLILKEEKDILYFDPTKIVPVQKRGYQTGNFDYYKINQLFRFHKKYIVGQNNDYIAVPKNKIKEIKPTICAHINLINDYNKIKQESIA